MDIISSILELPKQYRQAWDEASQIKLPENWKVNKVVVCGMGGSALGAHIIQCSKSLNVPLVINSNYSLPSGFGDNTLVVLASYSGNTEEVLSSAEDAKAKGHKIIGITTGGKLAEWLKENNCPGYIFDPKYNSTKAPRMSVGYMLVSAMAFFENLGFYQGGYTDDLVAGAVQNIEDNKDSIQNEAKEFASKLKGKLPVVFAADYLVGNAHIFSNQLNETAKTFSTYFVIPEANHHLLEGLKHPELSSVAIFLGDRYGERTVKRFEITKEVLETNGWEVLWYKSKEDDSFTQATEVLLFSSLVTTYLAEEYGEDPLAIPTVDYFKENLG